MNSKERFFIGGLGALLPIAVVIVTVDLAEILNNVEQFVWFHYLFFGLRYFVVFLLGGFVAWLHDDENSKIKLVQIGIAAPAIISSLAAGGAFGDYAQGKFVESEEQGFVSQIEWYVTPETKIGQYTLVATDENSFEKYTVEYYLRIHVKEILLGEQASPLQLQFSDSRACSVTFTAFVVRNVHLIAGGRRFILMEEWSTNLGSPTEENVSYESECSAITQDIVRNIGKFKGENLNKARNISKRDIAPLSRSMEENLDMDIENSLGT